MKKEEELLTCLSLLHIIIGILQQLGNDGLNILTNIASLSERGAVTDGKGDIQALGYGLGQESLAWESKQKDSGA